MSRTYKFANLLIWTCNAQNAGGFNMTQATKNPNPKTESLTEMLFFRLGAGGSIPTGTDAIPYLFEAGKNLIQSVTDVGIKNNVQEQHRQVHKNNKNKPYKFEGGIRAKWYGSKWDTSGDKFSIKPKDSINYFLREGHATNGTNLRFEKVDE